METSYQRIPYKFGDEFVIKPIADVHLGNAACDERAFKDYLRESDEATYFIGIGDLMDAVIVSDAKRYRKGVDQSGVEDIIDYQVDRAAAFLSPYSERILGLGVGNHEDAILTKCSTDMTKRVCKRLGVRYLGYSGLYRLRFSEGNNNRTRTVDIRYHHGWASGRTQGGQLTSNAKDMLHWDADIFLYGHGHKMLTDSVSRLGIQGDDKLVSKDMVVCLCGTFLKTYIPHEITYSEKKGYGPQRIGQPFLTIKPTRDGVRIKAQTY